MPWWSPNDVSVLHPVNMTQVIYWPNIQSYTSVRYAVFRETLIKISKTKKYVTAVVILQTPVNKSHRSVLVAKVVTSTLVMLPCNCGSFWTSFCGFLCTLCTPHSRRDWRCRDVLDPSGMTHVILWLPLHLVYTLHTSWLTMSRRPWSVRNDARHSVASFAPYVHLTHVVIDDVATSLIRQEWHTSFGQTVPFTRSGSFKSNLQLTTLSITDHLATASSSGLWFTSTYDIHS